MLCLGWTLEREVVPNQLASEEAQERQHAYHPLFFRFLTATQIHISFTVQFLVVGFFTHRTLRQPLMASSEARIKDNKLKAAQIVRERETYRFASPVWHSCSTESRSEILPSN